MLYLPVHWDHSMIPGCILAEDHALPGEPIYLKLLSKSTFEENICNTAS